MPGITNEFYLNASAEKIYLYGGYNSRDAGVSSWGSSRSHDILLVGDSAGDAVIEYVDGMVQKIPLLFGYTMWWHQVWKTAKSPFVEKGEVTADGRVLQQTLFGYGAFEGYDECILCIRPRKTEIRKVTILDNDQKMGEPIFTKVTVACEDEAANQFFLTHTIDSMHPVSPAIKENLDKIMHCLYHYEAELENVLPSEAPAEFVCPKIEFSGCHEARIFTNIFRDNCHDLLDKIEEDGGISASTRFADNWGTYDGFGTWTEKMSSYYTLVYSRDGGRAAMTIADIGKIEETRRIIDYFNEKLMFFPESGLTFGGKSIPGHWTVIVNKPLIYSETLTDCGWPTKYTKERFGEEYRNLGNHETDGHGLVMMATYKYYLNTGRDAGFVRENWKFIQEAACYIEWCFENPALSFLQDDLLYGETEAAMNDYTLYANVPCCFGMLFYSEMAARIDETSASKRWLHYHERLADAIERNLSAYHHDLKTWNIGKFGFLHDPTATMLCDIYGFDLDLFPRQGWIEKFRNTYQIDIGQYIGETLIAPRGLGYDYGMILQNALLSDNYQDYTGFSRNLSKVCYSPRFTDRYIVPECSAADVERGIYHRVADVGNLVQQAEILKCITIICGAFMDLQGDIRIYPRLPMDFDLEATELPVMNGGGRTSSIRIQKKQSEYRINLVLNKTQQTEIVYLRTGPFCSGFVEIEIDSVKNIYETRQTGSMKWVLLALGTARNAKTIEITAREIG